MLPPLPSAGGAKALTMGEGALATGSWPRMPSVDPAARPRRGPLYRELAAAGARFAEIDGGAVAIGFGDDPAAEARSARELGISDLTLSPRAGYKGWAAIDWARRHGLVIGEDNNRAYAQSDGGRVARLADSEILILGGLGEPPAAIARLAAAGPVAGAYSVPRADTNCWFAISGADAAAMFTKLCGVDLRPKHFADGAVAQTSVAWLNAILIRADRGAVPAFDLLTDVASASYMWSCLTDAMAEFGGRPIGTDALGGLGAVAS